jgi:hypothetical protein
MAYNELTPLIDSDSSSTSLENLELGLRLARCFSYALLHSASARSIISFLYEFGTNIINVHTLQKVLHILENENKTIGCYTQKNDWTFLYVGALLVTVVNAEEMRATVERMEQFYDEKLSLEDSESEERQQIEAGIRNASNMLRCIYGLATNEKINDCLSILSSVLGTGTRAAAVGLATYGSVSNIISDQNYGACEQVPEQWLSIVILLPLLMAPYKFFYLLGKGNNYPKFMKLCAGLYGGLKFIPLLAGLFDEKYSLITQRVADGKSIKEQIMVCSGLGLAVLFMTGSMVFSSFGDNNIRRCKSGVKTFTAQEGRDFGLSVRQSAFVHSLAFPGAAVIGYFFAEALARLVSAKEGYSPPDKPLDGDHTAYQAVYAFAFIITFFAMLPRLFLGWAGWFMPTEAIEPPPRVMSRINDDETLEL